MTVAPLWGYTWMCLAISSYLSLIIKNCTGKEIKMLFVLAKKRESTIIFRLIKDIDPNAFVSQSAVIGVYGEGFDRIKVK